MSIEALYQSAEETSMLISVICIHTYMQTIVYYVNTNDVKRQQRFTEIQYDHEAKKGTFPFRGHRLHVIGTPVVYIISVFQER